LERSDARLPHALEHPQAKVVIFMRSRVKRSDLSAAMRGKQQERRGFVLVDAGYSSLADVRAEINRQRMPVPKPFLFVLDLPGGIEEIVLRDEELQVMVDELQPFGRAVLVHDEFHAVWDGTRGPGCAVTDTFVTPAQLRALDEEAEAGEANAVAAVAMTAARTTQGWRSCLGEVWAILDCSPLAPASSIHYSQGAAATRIQAAHRGQAARAEGDARQVLASARQQLVAGYAVAPGSR
jgi:hypothetical protein